MTLGKTIKSYRKDNGYSQADLAKALSVSPMTISRLESDQPIRIPDQLAKGIVELIGAERIQSVDDSSRNLAVIRRRELAPGQEHRLIDEELVHSCERALADVFSKDGIKIVCPHAAGRGDLLVQMHDKKWVVEIMTGPFHWPQVRERLALGIGHCSMDRPINKFSLVWAGENFSDIQSITPIQTYNSLNFDVSLIHYDTAKHKFDFEMDISALFDGKGMFDTRVPDSAKDAAVLYATWKSSLV